MDLKALIAKMDQIESRKFLVESALTIQQVQAAEKQAADAAAAAKKKGGWKGFTTWDPKTAGDIALSKLATDNGLPGLINSKGEFVVAGDGTQKPQVAPPNADDMKALAAAGLMPGNTQGPSAVTKFLGDPSAAVKGQPTQGDKELTQYKQQSANIQGAKSSAEFIQPRLKKLNDLVAKISGAAAESIVFNSAIANSLIESFGYKLNERVTLGTGAPTTNPATGVTAGKFQAEIAEIRKLMSELADIEDPEVIQALNAAQAAIDKVGAATPAAATPAAATPAAATPAAPIAQSFPVSPQPTITSRPEIDAGATDMSMGAAGAANAADAAAGATDASLGASGAANATAAKIQRFKDLLNKAESPAANKPAAAAANKPAAAAGGTYQIKPGDNLTKIAKANGTTIQAIMAVNPQITDPNKIQAGATLTLPGGAQSSGQPASPAAPKVPSKSMGADSPAYDTQGPSNISSMPAAESISRLMSILSELDRK